jgi:hypothetical protein
MQILKHPHADNRPSLRPALRDPSAELDRVNYVATRYKMPPAQVAEMMPKLDIREQVLIEIEMAERRSDLWRSDYDPFARS